MSSDVRIFEFISGERYGSDNNFSTSAFYYMHRNN